jgi:hypothetical protein
MPARCLGGWEPDAGVHSTAVGLCVPRPDRHLEHSHHSGRLVQQLIAFVLPGLLPQPTPLQQLDVCAAAYACLIAVLSALTALCVHSFNFHEQISAPVCAASHSAAHQVMADRVLCFCGASVARHFRTITQCSLLRHFGCHIFAEFASRRCSLLPAGRARHSLSVTTQPELGR